MGNRSLFSPGTDPAQILEAIIEATAADTPSDEYVAAASRIAGWAADHGPSTTDPHGLVRVIVADLVVFWQEMDGQSFGALLNDLARNPE